MRQQYVTLCILSWRVLSVNIRPAKSTQPFHSVHSFVTEDDSNCSVCGKPFPTVSKRNRHEDTHRPPRFKCEICGVEFRQNAHLKRHSNTHARVPKPASYACSVCGKDFATPFRRRRHEAVHNPPELECNRCDAKFRLHQELKKHSARVHEKRGVKRRYEDNLNRIAVAGMEMEELPMESQALPTADPPEFSGEEVKIPSDWPEHSESLLRKHWRLIRSEHTRTKNKRVEEFNIRLDPKADIASSLKLWTRDIFARQKFKFYLNFQFGYFLSRLSENEYDAGPSTSASVSSPPDEPPVRWFYGSNNTRFFSNRPPLISDRQSLEGGLASLDSTDLVDWACSNRDDSKWTFLSFTNVTVRLVKLQKHPIRGTVDRLPPYIVGNQNIVGLVRNRSNGRLYDDDKCAFRCIALALGAGVQALETLTQEIFMSWCDKQNIEPNQFNGVTVADFAALQRQFALKMNAWEFVIKSGYLPEREDGDAHGESVCDDHDEDDPFAALSTEEEDSVYDTLAVEEALADDPNAWCLSSVHLSPIRLTANITEVNLLLHKDHFCFIKEIDKCLHSFQCPKCSYIFPHRGHFNHHVNNCKGISPKCKFPGGGFHLKRNVFERLALLGISIPRSNQLREYFAVFDCESYQERVTEPQTGKLRWMGELIPASVAICANVPGYQTGVCFVSDGDPAKLGDKLLERLNEIQSEAEKRNTSKFKPYIDAINKEIARVDNLIQNSTDQSSPQCLFHWKRSEGLRMALGQLESWIAVLPVFTFNGSRFDMNLLRKHIFPKLIRSKQIGNVIKKNSGYMSICIGNLHMQDVSNFLAAGTSYDQMLKAFKVSHSKFLWPYDWFVSLSQLNEKHLPPREAFWSCMKQAGISVEDYQLVERTWEAEQFGDMRGYLIYYNIQDVEPFVEAVEKMTEWWRENNIDMLSQGVSLPTLSLRDLHSNMQPGCLMPLVNEANADLFWLMKQQITGGPSLVFHRYHEKDVTKIRGNGKLCRSIRGLDCNALYLWCIMQEMPMNVYYRWRKNLNGRFSRRNMYEYSLKETQWVTWVEHKIGYKICHRFNGGQVDFGCGGACGAFKKIPVDGYCPETETIYQFFGCHYHAHGCRLDNNAQDVSRVRRDLTRRVTDYLVSIGYRVEAIYECEFDQMVKDKSSGLGKFVHDRYTLKFNKTEAEETQILEAVKSGKFFGMCEVSISVPDDLKEKFSEFQPIFVNREVSFEDLTSDFMKEYAQKHGFLKRPQRMLLASFTGEKILLITTLLKWLLEHGLVVTKLHQAFQAVGSVQFAAAGEKVAQCRRNADADPEQKMKAEMGKAVGNCYYGRAVTDVTRHRDTVFCTEKDVEKLMRDPRFSDLETIDEDTYEVDMQKKAYTFDLPFQIGFFVYQYAKLRMLAFYHDFIDKYIPRDSYQLCQMDTDSFYMALAAESLDDLVPPELKEEYRRDKHNWLPREDTPEHSAFDKRTPGLFKVEWRGDGLISLTSKLYYGWSSADGAKIACKGVRRLNQCISKENFEHTLKTGDVISGTNMGFRMHQNVLKAYQQEKAAITGFYAKRPVAADGISTSACPL